MLLCLYQSAENRRRCTLPRADSREQVDAFWQAALAAGGGQRRAGATAKLPRQLLRRL